MTTRLLLRAALGGLAVWAAALVLVSAVVTGYAVALGVAAQGEPDADRIERFARLFSPGAVLLLSGALAFGAGRWAAGGRERRRRLERGVGVGLGVGLGAALPPLARTLAAGGALRPSLLLLFAATAGAGLLGAVTGSRSTDPAEPRHTP